MTKKRWWLIAAGILLAAAAAAVLLWPRGTLGELYKEYFDRYEVRGVGCWDQDAHEELRPREGCEAETVDALRAMELRAAPLAREPEDEPLRFQISFGAEDALAIDCFTNGLVRVSGVFPRVPALSRTRFYRVTGVLDLAALRGLLEPEA